MVGSYWVNYENTYSLNKTELFKEAKVFGFAWMGNGAIIHKMPLMNILVLNGTTAPMTILIHDCTTTADVAEWLDRRLK
jgi:hypothetical protein